MLDANSIGDHLTAKLSNSIALDSAKAEAVTAKAEWIENQLQRGVAVEGHDLDTIIETVLDNDGINEALKTAYLYGNPQSINVLVDAEITRLANAIAPDLVQAHLDYLEDVA
ncbi:hypothetical protein ACRN98_22180 [Shewanella oncorhynchi]|uniref:hypothetical protein n=1 Tax=Shewanella TaxID=22 RepID=UPI0021D9B532|nr:hypothetical protein [Shewanella sp. SM69]MCU8036973.1 hypothetical protein [Shewanella sp. SM69]